jgi:putative glutamine amidotransferase
MKMKPRIAIPVPTSRDLAYNGRSWPAYATAVERSGGEAVRLEMDASEAEIRELAASCQGFCLPGSPADVDPTRFGEETDIATAPADPAREAADNLLLEMAYATRKPVLGICFGVQSLNVFRGGSLVQDLLPLPVNHSAGGKVAIAHTVLVAEESVLGALLSQSPELREEAPPVDGFLRLPINTSHHQAIASPGEGLRIVGRCPDDGVIEAVEGDPADLSSPAFLLGVQWHPERSYDISAASRAIFDRLVLEAAHWIG